LTVPPERIRPIRRSENIEVFETGDRDVKWFKRSTLRPVAKRLLKEGQFEFFTA
jgi:hypothetical protein